MLDIHVSNETEEAPYDIYNELISEARGEGGEEGADEGSSSDPTSPTPLCHVKQGIQNKSLGLFSIDEEKEELV